MTVNSPNLYGIRGGDGESQSYNGMGWRGHHREEGMNMWMELLNEAVRLVLLSVVLPSLIAILREIVQRIEDGRGGPSLA